VGFSDDVTLDRKDFGKGFPRVGIENTLFQVSDFVVKLSEGASITTTEHPGHGSPCAMIHGFDDPEFLFFEPMKCLISSNSISVIFPETSGSGRRSPKERTQR
jgi:hypothetical protein